MEVKSHSATLLIAIRCARVRHWKVTDRLKDFVHRAGEEDDEKYNYIDLARALSEGQRD